MMPESKTGLLALKRAVATADELAALEVLRQLQLARDKAKAAAILSNISSLYSEVSCIPTSKSVLVR